MAEEDDKPVERSPFRNVGQALGGWARRVGALVTDAASPPTIPEALREPLREARAARMRGDHQAAIEQLRELSNDAPLVLYSLGLSYLYDLASGGRPFKAMTDLEVRLGDRLGRAPAQLLSGGVRLYESRTEAALDQLRRATVGLDRLPPELEAESRMWLHILTALGELERGHEIRALRELRKARARIPEDVGEPLRTFVLQRGVNLALAADHLDDAEYWLRDMLARVPGHRPSLELQCRLAAAKGDRLGARALLETLSATEPDALETRLWVGLTVGLDETTPLPRLAMQLIQARPNDTQALRIWALAELVRHREDAGTAPLPNALLDALALTATTAPPSLVDRALQELAHAALRLDRFEGDAVQQVLDRYRADPATAPEEVRLIATRAALARGTVLENEFSTDDVPRFRAEADVGGPQGPDPQSPVRQPALRKSILAGQRALASAELCLLRDLRDAAQDLLVEALVHDPKLSVARTKLAELALSVDATRLEDLLSQATSVLAAIPHRVLGVRLDGIQTAMRDVIAARERLARPLTIAIMGEFSAGKSTFVNALLGEAVAPMGVLPTTTTINVFRRGHGSGARVHYRDGTIAVVSTSDVQPFLHGLDDTEAQRIRHVEIERTGPRMGDAAVVDTPGLNALDDYHERVARDFLDQADAVVWVFSATRGGAASEAQMLKELRESGRSVLGVLNKVDTLDEHEQRELNDYLRDQLGEVLVEVVPLRGNDALAWRTQTEAAGEDPFAAVEQALDQHFLKRARELKRALTTRRLIEALDGARQTIDTVASTLEARATAVHEREADRSVVEALKTFATATRTVVLELDDVLTREGLSLGLLHTGRGLAKGPLDPLDTEYLEGCVRDRLMDGLKRALTELRRDDALAAAVVEQNFIPWARGYIQSMVSYQQIAQLFEGHGPRIRKGEQAAREAFRTGLEPMANAWAEGVLQVTRDLDQARARTRREGASKPQAEALRLRTAVLVSIEHIRAKASNALADPELS